MDSLLSDVNSLKGKVKSISAQLQKPEVDFADQMGGFLDVSIFIHIEMYDHSATLGKERESITTGNRQTGVYDKKLIYMLCDAARAART